MLKAGEALDMIDHSFKWVIDKYASETKEGLKHEECSGCKLVRSKDTVIPKLVHNPKLVEKVAPTCTADGMDAHYYCGNCGRYYAVENGEQGSELSKEALVLTATGHTFGEGVEWQHDETGHWQVCVCGEKSEVAEHTFELTGAKEATETEEGYTGDEACICGLVKTPGEVIPALGQPTEVTTVPTEAPDVQEQPKNAGGSTGGIIAIIIGIIVLCGGGAYLGVKKPWQK
jgi:hypothetical protein